MEWGEAIFIASGILGALLLSWMGRLHVRIPRALLRRSAGEPVRDEPRTIGLAAARDHARAGAALADELLERLSMQGTEMVDFLQDYADACDELAERAEGLLGERRGTRPGLPEASDESSPIAPL